MPITRVVIGTSLVALVAQPVAAQFPRLAPPPPCRASFSSPALLGYWPSEAARDSRRKVAVFALQPDVDDAGRVYLAVALPDRIRQRLSQDPRLRLASEGSVARAMSDARFRQDSAAVLLGADYLISGRLLLEGSRQEVEVVLQRRGQSAPAWRATFRATTSLRSVENAIVSGLSRALGLPAAPPMPKGWPTTDAGHEAILAGDAYLRTTTRVGSDSAIGFYERALAVDPGSTVAAARLARASVTTLERGGEIPGYPGAAGPRRVSELIGRAYTSDTSAEGWTTRAMLARVMDPIRFTGAVAAHFRAVNADPRNADAEHEYAVTLLRLGDSRLAQARFRRALALAPGRPATFASLAWMDLQASRWNSVCVLSNASIAAWPYDPLPYAVRAEARIRLSDTRDAYSDAELVRRLATGAAWPHALGVLIAKGANDVDEARQLTLGLTGNWLAPATDFTVRDAEYLALAYLAMGDRRRAVESLRRARPVGTDLRVALLGPRLAALRTDTAVVRMLAETLGRTRE